MTLNKLKSPTRRSWLGMWTVAFAFAAVMAFTTVPTPLWSLFARRDHFSSLTISLVFAVYAVAVAASLFLAGHLSDSLGRRRIMIPALALNLLAAVVFVVWPELPGLVVARALSGLGVGAITATATAWITELGGGRRGATGTGRAQIVAAAANLGGLGLGGLVAGVLAQWAGDATALPFLVFVGALLVALAGVSVAVETRQPRVPRPAYHPQHVSVPPASRRRFFAAAAAAAITFAMFGLMTSLAPSFLAETLHLRSHALAGAVAFGMFGSAVVAQALTRQTAARLLDAGIPALVAGIALVTAAVWLPSLPVLLAGDLVAGVGAGLLFKGAIGTVAEIAPPARRAEALAGLFLAAYLGLAGPVIGLGALTQIASVPVSLLIFAGLLELGILAATPALVTRRDRQPSPNSQPAHVERTDHAHNAIENRRTGPHRPADHPRRVRRLGDRRRGLGVRVGAPGGREVDRRDPSRAGDGDQLDRHGRGVRVRPL